MFMGPMGASKTTRAVEHCVCMSALGKKVLYVNSCLDKRVLEGGVEGVFTSHNSSLKYLSDKVGTVSCSVLRTVNFVEYDVIVIDEAQFFNDIVESVERMVAAGKSVRVYGLSSDSDMCKFGRVQELIPIADRFKQLRAKCSVCFGHAAFTLATQRKQGQVAAGGMDQYMPVCRGCWQSASCNHAS